MMGQQLVLMAGWGRLQTPSSLISGVKCRQSEQWGLSAEGVCPASIRLRIWTAVEARQRGGVSV